jgi:hypothetical protein
MNGDEVDGFDEGNTIESLDLLDLMRCSNFSIRLLPGGDNHR